MTCRYVESATRLARICSLRLTPWRWPDTWRSNDSWRVISWLDYDAPSFDQLHLHDGESCDREYGDGCDGAKIRLSYITRAFELLSTLSNRASWQMGWHGSDLRSRLLMTSDSTTHWRWRLLLMTTKASMTHLFHDIHNIQRPGFPYLLNCTCHSIPRPLIMTHLECLLNPNPCLSCPRPCLDATVHPQSPSSSTPFCYQYPSEKSTR